MRTRVLQVGCLLAALILAIFPVDATAQSRTADLHSGETFHKQVREIKLEETGNSEVDFSKPPMEVRRDKPEVPVIVEWVYIQPENVEWWTGSVWGDITGHYYDHEGDIVCGDWLYGAYRYRGYAVFNTASIPDNACIQSIYLYVWTSVEGSDDHCLSIVGDIGCDPRVTVGRQLFDYLGNGIQFHDNTCLYWGRTSGEHSDYLNSEAAIDLEETVQRGQDWWALGFIEPGDDAGAAWFAGREYQWPYALVTYILPVQDPPSLSQPPNGETVCESYVQFRWGSVTRADEYDLWLDGSIVWSGSETSHQHYVPGLGQHTWKVRGKNSCGNGPWSSTWSFTREDPVTQAPNLSQPSNGSTICESYVEFGWGSVNRADEYDLWLDGSIVWSGSGTSHQHYVPGLGQHTWKVRGKNDCGDGPWSSTWSFTREDPVTQPPGLLHPPDGAVLYNSYVEFRWNAAANADQYDLWLDGSIVWTGPQTSYSRYVSEGGHIWQVRGKNECGDGPWSSTRSFTVQGAVTEPPTLLQPLDGALLCDSYVQFRWNPVNNADEYDLWLDGDTVWSGPETSHGRDILEGDHTWKVSGKNPGGNGPWSSEWSFMRVDSITTSPSHCQATDSLCDTVTTSWNWEQTGHDGFKVYRNGSEIGEAGSSARFYHDLTAEQGQTYSYFALAFNQCGNGPESDSDSGSVRDFPDSAVLLLPENGQSIFEPTIPFVWEWPAFFDTCKFVISKSPDLDPAVLDSPFVKAVDTLKLELSDTAVYYWAVFTLSCDDSASSDTFRVGAQTGIESSALQIPTEYSLGQCYPNPFNARTRISYGLPRNSQVLLQIYDLTGRLVRTLVSEYQTAGYKAVIWDGRNDQGLTACSGIYFYRLKAEEFHKLVKMTILK